MKPPLIAIVGPTAVGKTSLALHLARSLDIEVVNADSRQVYRHMDIGTAKPSPQERSQLRHHLIDIVNPDEPFSLATYLDLARRAIAQIHQRGRLSVVVGGTGQYLWGLLEHWHVPRVPPDLELREQLYAEDPQRLFAQLGDIDPAAAERIHPRNVRRIVRALEVYYHTGVPLSRQQGRGEPPFTSYVIGLTMPRERLYRRIDQRTDRMMAGGWLDEVRWLREHGYGPELPAMSSTGYRELMAYLSDGAPWQETVQSIKTGLHRLARHQYNWFHLSDPRIRWLEASLEVAPPAEALIRSFMVE